MPSDHIKIKISECYVNARHKTLAHVLSVFVFMYTIFAGMRFEFFFYVYYAILLQLQMTTFFPLVFPPFMENLKQTPPPPSKPPRNKTQ